jgi:acyl dehydratase
VKIGRTAEHRRRFTPADIAEYARISGHEPEPQSVPEPMINALFSCLLGMYLPGRGTHYLKQQSRFIAAAAVGDELIARVVVSRWRPEKHLVDLSTSCHASDGTLLADGRALVFVRDVSA